MRGPRLEWARGCESLNVLRKEEEDEMKASGRGSIWMSKVKPSLDPESL